MTTLLILPGTAYLFFSKYKFSAESFKKIGLMLLIFFPALIVVYLYLPLRAMQDPVINWEIRLTSKTFSACERQAIPGLALLIN
jgi:hypothetical protein